MKMKTKGFCIIGERPVTWDYFVGMNSACQPATSSRMEEVRGFTSRGAEVKVHGLGSRIITACVLATVSAHGSEKTPTPATRCDSLVAMKAAPLPTVPVPSGEMAEVLAHIQEICRPNSPCSQNEILRILSP